MGSLTPQTTSMAMWFFEFFPQSANVPYGVGARADDVMLMRDVEELVGKHFPDIPGEEDCTKSRPMKAKQVVAFMLWLSAKLNGCDTTAEAKHKDLTSLKVSVERLETLVIKMVVDHFEEPLSEAQARLKLR